MSVTFHLLDSIAQDTKHEEKDSYTIYLFGSTAEGKPVQCEVQGFQPFFYIELPPTKDAFSDFLERMDTDKGISFEECSKSPMYGYTGGKKMNLVKISTTTILFL
jgi:hypothetical protein